MAPQIEQLRVRLEADKSEGQRIRRFDPDTGEPYLANPDTGEREPWPLLGVRVEGDPPKLTRVPTSWVTRGITEGWLETVNLRVEHRPGGPPHDPWRVTHTFTHTDEIILKAPEPKDDVRYQVVHQPDKYADDSVTDERGRVTEENNHDDDTPVSSEIYNAGETRVDWYYDLKLVTK